LKSNSTSLASSDDVGSSRTSSFASTASAFAISTIEQFPRPRVQLAPIDQAERAETPRFAPDEDVFGDRQVRRKAQFLMHEADAERLGLRRVLRIDLAPVEYDLAAVFPHDSGENLHQSGFARAVFAHQRMNLASPRLEIHRGERPRAGERFRYSAHLEDCGLRRIDEWWFHSVLLI
jgi:hypothetical protein